MRLTVGRQAPLLTGIISPHPHDGGVVVSHAMRGPGVGAVRAARVCPPVCGSPAFASSPVNGKQCDPHAEGQVHASNYPIPAHTATAR